MGAERFFDIKCRASGLTPDAAVVVVTVRALKVHSGHHRVVAGRPLPPAILEENPDEVRAGGVNLRKQIENIQLFGVTPVVAINVFPGDFVSEHEAIREIAASMGVRAAVCTNFADGGEGAVELARAVAEAVDDPSEFRLLYPTEMSLRDKIETIATKVYGADGVDYLPAANRQIDSYEKNGFGNMPVIIAKTHLSLSSDAKLKGAPTGWRMPVREARASVGAGFIYLICGDMSTMPGLSTHPAAEIIDIDDNGEIVGLS
jgi:formate--tetrahydrofolate ligase